MTRLKMNASQLLTLMSEIFPFVDQMALCVEELAPGALTIARDTTEADIRPGGTISGPAMMALVDTAAYLLVLAHIGPEALAVTTSLNINFLRKPVPGKLAASAEMLKLGKRLAIVEVSILNGAHRELVAHATVTYSIPPDSNG